MFRDDGGNYGHSTDGNWGGIVSVLRGTMVTYAR
jgi:hypothetical protein